MRLIHQLELEELGTSLRFVVVVVVFGVVVRKREGNFGIFERSQIFFIFLKRVNEKKKRKGTGTGKRD